MNVTIFTPESPLRDPAKAVPIPRTYELVRASLRREPRTWLVTGCAGFIGSHLVEHLLRLDQRVVGLDNFSTGREVNLQDVAISVGAEHWKRFSLIKGDIDDLEACQRAVSDVNGLGKPDYVLHQAALGSVPRSIDDPIAANRSNIDGFLNMLVAARDAGVLRFVYAGSSSTYGDHPSLPKREDVIGRPLSPYAVTKYVNELYADVFARSYGLSVVGLRYFNVFGPRQNPDGAYAAVIPKWISAILKNETIFINGDGQTSRDFCFVANVVQANLLAATTADPEAVNQVYNIACGARTTLNELFDVLAAHISRVAVLPARPKPVHREPRPGDVPHSHAAIDRARRYLGYEPTHSVEDGLKVAVKWYSGGGVTDTFAVGPK